MPPITRITKNDILTEAYEIVRKQGFDALNARVIAKNLNCSIQPIFHNFANMETLKTEVLEIIFKTYQIYMNKNLDKEFPYKQIGINYINFAKEEPKLFQIMFMNDTELTTKNYIENDKSKLDIPKYVSLSNGLSIENATKYHLKMWVFTHGIACLVAMKTCSFTDEEINIMLKEEYKALNLLEGEKNEKKCN